MYYLRARYYNPANGRFITMDSYEGNPVDPLSLHKYLYCAADPVNKIDPSGHSFIVEFSITSAKRAGLAAATFGTIGTAYAKAKGATWGAALAHGARIGALAGGSILSPALGAGLLAEAPLLIGLGIYNEDITAGNIPEYATYIAAGFALQYVFKMPAFSPPGVPAATTLGVTLSAEARSLIAGTSDDILLRVVDKAGTVRLFKSGRGQIEGHPDLIKQGLIQGDAQGFSIAVKNGKVVGLFRNSKLNESLPDYNLPAETTSKILQQIGHDGVRVFGVE